MDKEIELAGEEQNAKNWRGIGISLLVIFLVCSLIVVAVIVRSPREVVYQEQNAFSIDDILDKRFEPKRFNGTWINDDEFAFLSDQLDIVKFNCTNRTKSLVISNTVVRQLVGDKFKFYMTGDPNVVLLSYDMKQVFRHSIVSRYKIYNTISTMPFHVLPPGTMTTDQIQNALLSPNSRRLAFVYQNNIFLMQQFFDGKSDSLQITKDGLELTIYNGITDWLYEEEIMYQTNAMWWSDDSAKLAFIKFDDSQVEYYQFPSYDGSAYNSQNKVRYPKPDSRNPIATAFVYLTDSTRTIELNVPDMVQKMFGDYYIWNLKWMDSNHLMIIYVNRNQNSAIIVKYEATNGRIIFAETYPSPPLKRNDAWFLPSGFLTARRHHQFFQIWPSQGYKNIIAFQNRNGKPSIFTSHQFDVTDLLFLNEKTGYIYYLATNGDPKQRHLFKKHILDTNRRHECLTCNETTQDYAIDMPALNQQPLDGDHCRYYSASFSGGGDYYILECLGDRIPTVTIKSESNPEYEHVIESNDELAELLKTKIMPKKSYLRVYFDDKNSTHADAEVLYPNNFAEDGAYPVLVFLYNGPSSQTVDFQFRVRRFESFICINFGIIVGIIDGHGTDSNGDKFMKSVSRQLGHAESADQLSLVKALKREVYVDDRRFAVWGWSYGGFLSAMLLFQDNSPFRCAVVGAPVTDWLFYDTAYTERYMGSYLDNKEAYAKSNLTHLAKLNEANLMHKRMLLVHGTGDDNVHFQNSAILAKTLRATKIDLEFEVYPDIQHTPDDATQRNLYQKMTKFLLGCYNMNYMNFYEQLNYQHLMDDIFPVTSSENKDD